MGSEMCIRDRPQRLHERHAAMDTAALGDRARAAMETAAQLQAQAGALVARAAYQALERGLRPSPRDHPRLLRRLTAAESRAANLEEALASNRRIGMAIGILMAHHRLTEEQAFDVLRRQSNRSNVKLVRLAEGVIYIGELEPAHPSSIPESRTHRRADGVP